MSYDEEIINQGKRPWEVILSFPRLHLRRISENSIETIANATNDNDAVPLSCGSVMEALINDTLKEKEEKIKNLEQNLNDLQEKYNTKCAQSDGEHQYSIGRMNMMCTNCRDDVNSDCPIMPPVCSIKCLDELM